MRVSVIDGRSFEDSATGDVYRLYGIETCDLAQRAEMGRQAWHCGVVAMAWLTAATLDKWVACNSVLERPPVRYARCATAEHHDLAHELIKAGHAVVSFQGEGLSINAYRTAEADAKRAQRGLWGSRFEMPWSFRERVAAEARPGPSLPSTRTGSP